MVKKPRFHVLAIWGNRLVFWLGAIVVGLLIVSLTWLSEWAAHAYRTLANQYVWFAFVIPPLGLAFIAWVTFRFFPGSERSGIPQIKTALELSGSRIIRPQLLSLKMALGKLLLPIFGLLSGASVGFGGLSVYIGACIMLSVGQLVKTPAPYNGRSLILAGSAAGFAALFNTPLAGIMFAIEEMGRTLDEKIANKVLTAIILSGVTAYALLDNRIYLEDEALLMPLGYSWLAVPLCGMAGGILGGLFSKITIVGSQFLNRTGFSVILMALLCGGVIAAVNYYSHGATAGTGYQQTKMILQNASNMEVNFPFFKLLATWATFFSGIPSGIFVPSLATGAGLGVDLARWLPVAPATAMILLSMAAYFSGMLQSPLTSFVIVMEMTNTHEILIPLMATTYIATWISKLIHPIPLYLALCDSYKTFLEKSEQNKK